MRRFQMLWIFLLLLVPILVTANGLDTLGFISPVDHTIKLTGNFMELRSNHFHAGIDIKSTNGQSGDNIKTVQDGYISRIKIQSGGYGNVLYIDHPNGYTTVYAHLSKFVPELENYVKQIQYTLESFEVDIYLDTGKFTFKQGEKIGEMGNSGRSFGPHLHFEIRETKTEKPLNPQYFGIGPSDKRAPTLESLHLHQLTEQGEIISKTVKYFNPKSKSYRLYQDTLEVSSSHLGIGLQMFDRMDGSWNKNGIYGFELSVNDSIAISWKADEFSFQETRYINAFWDFERKEKHGQKVYLLYKSSCNPFSYYDGGGNGIIILKDRKDKRVSLRAYDLHGNESTLEFVVRNSKKVYMDSKSSLDCDTIHNKSAGYFDVQFGANSFYFPVSLNINYKVKSVDGQECPSIEIGERHIPVNGNYFVKCPLPKTDLEKWTMVKIDEQGRMKQFAAEPYQDYLHSQLDELGLFSLYKDTIAPRIQPISFSKSNSSNWKIKITDNLIPDGNTENLAYIATIDGQWIRMRYDAKNDLLTFSDNDKLPDSPAIFRLIVSDHCGNVSRYERVI